MPNHEPAVSASLALAMVTLEVGASIIVGEGVDALPVGSIAHGDRLRAWAARHVARLDAQAGRNLHAKWGLEGPCEPHSDELARRALLAAEIVLQRGVIPAIPRMCKVQKWNASLFDALEKVRHARSWENLEEALPGWEDARLTHDYLSLVRSLLRRILAWPVFVLEAESTSGSRRVTGLSLPVCIDVAYDGRRDVWIRWCKSWERADTRTTETLAGSLVRAADFARSTWAKNHRHVERTRDAAECSVFIDLRPASLALFELGINAQDTLHGNQRSLEAYIASAVVCRLLGLRTGSRTAATGVLERPEQGTVTWQRADVPEGTPGHQAQLIELEHQAQLVEAMVLKARHIASAGECGLFVVPADDRQMHVRVTSERHEARREGVRMPHVVTSRSLSRYVDHIAPAQWRPRRSVRADDVLVRLDRDEMALLDADVRGAIDHALRSERRGLFIVTDDVEETAYAVCRTLDKLTWQHHASWLAFRGVPHESGLAFLTTLVAAISGRVPLDQCANLELTYRSSVPEGQRMVTATVAAWMNHAYSTDEPWQAPQVTVLWGMEHLRAWSRQKELHGGDPLDAWHALQAVSRLLAEAPCVPIPRLGKLRLVLVSDDPPDAHHDDWSVLDLRGAGPAPSRAPETPADACDPSFLPEEIALQFFRSALPHGTALSACEAVLHDGQPRSGEARFARLRRAASTPESPLFERHDRFGVMPSGRDARAMQAIRPISRVHVHLAIAASLAPWAELEQIIARVTDRDVKEVSKHIWQIEPDKWFAPELLGEAIHHLKQAALLAHGIGPMGTGDLSDDLLVKVTRIMRFGYGGQCTLANELNRVHHEQAYEEWTKFLGRVGVEEHALPLGMRAIGGAIRSKCLRRVKAGRELVIEELRNAFPVSGENAARLVCRLYALCADLHADPTAVTTQPLGDLADACERSSVISSLYVPAEIYEGAGDASLAILDDVRLACRWYALALTQAGDFWTAKMKMQLFGESASLHSDVIGTYARDGSPIPPLAQAMQRLLRTRLETLPNPGCLPST